MRRKTKIGLWILGIIILALALIVLIRLSSNKNSENKGNSVNNELNNDEILSVVKTEASKYCSYLDGKANSSHCETCRGGNDYRLVAEFSSTPSLNYNLEYKVNKKDEGYKIEVQMNTIFGYNTRGGTEQFSFTINKNKSIISPTYPEKTCLD